MGNIRNTCTQNIPSIVLLLASFHCSQVRIILFGKNDVDMGINLKEVHYSIKIDTFFDSACYNTSVCVRIQTIVCSKAQPGAISD